MLSNVDAHGKLGFCAVLPPLVLIILVHAAINQFTLSPLIETVLVLVCMPPLLAWVSPAASACSGSVGQRFDADQELLGLLKPTLFAIARGQYLYKLRERFPGKVVADLFCYLQLYVELALYAKGTLMLPGLVPLRIALSDGADGHRGIVRPAIVALGVELANERQVGRCEIHSAITSEEG